MSTAQEDLLDVDAAGRLGFTPAPGESMPQFRARVAYSLSLEGMPLTAGGVRLIVRAIVGRCRVGVLGGEHKVTVTVQLPWWVRLLDRGRVERAHTRGIVLDALVDRLPITAILEVKVP